MAKVVIYSGPACPYCVKAKMLLERKGVDFEEIDVTKDAGIRKAMTEKSGGMRTIPQIFIDDKHVGGCDDLHDLESQGKLEGVLGL